MTKEAFKDLFDTHFDTVRNYIFYRSGDTELATDITQETFLKIWEKRISIDTGKIKGLLFKIARGLLINQYRKQKTILNFNKSVKIQNEERSPEDEIEFKELKLKYERALSNLTEKQRTVFLMSRYDGMKYHEIAESLEISVKAVEKRMSKTLSYLKIALNDKLY